MNAQTIQTQPAELPAWAAKNEAVAARCKVNLAFRCAVFAAKTAQVKRVLRLEAERLAK